MQTSRREKAESIPTPNFLFRGAISGIVSSVVFFVGVLMLFGGNSDGIGAVIQVLPITAGPGLVFGLLIGRAIGRGLGAGERFEMQFLAASTGCCFLIMMPGFLLLGATIGVAREVHPVIRPLAFLWSESWIAGAFCGLLGASALAALTRYFLPDSWEFKAWLPVLVSTISGGVLLPATIEIPFLGIVIFHVGFQTALAASLGTSIWEK